MDPTILISGFGGGAVRGLVGFLKYSYSYKNTPFNLAYFLATTFLSGAIGLLSAAAVSQSGLILVGLEGLTPALALIVGYAGGDFLENLYKIILKKPVLFPGEKR